MGEKRKENCRLRGASATLEAKLEQLMEMREPDADDCYEYKLVGVNVHHGTADSGIGLPD